MQNDGAKAGIKDMVRISDARMSGTAYGTVILHVAPDAASGGNLALVKNGDRIKISVANRSIDVLVSEDELSKRRLELIIPVKSKSRGYQYLYDTHIMQADAGCDFDFLVPNKK